MNISSRGWFSISILFSLIVIIVVFVTTFNEETIGYILSFNLFFLGLAICFRMIALVIWGMRIKLMSLSLGYRIRLGYGVNMVLAGLLAGTITPGGAGGEPVRIHELYCAGVNVGDATTIVIMERVLDGIILTVMGLVIMTMTGFIWNTFSSGLIILVIAAWIFMISFMFIPVLAVRYPEKTKKVIMRFITWIAGKLSRMSSIQKISARADTEIDNLFASMSLFAGAARWGLLAGGIATGFFWICEFMVASVILMGLGLPPDILESFFFQILIAIVMMIPLTPGASGVTELSTSSLYALIIPSGMIGIFVLLWRFVTFYLNILLGTIASLSIFKREIEKKPEKQGEF